MNDIIDIWFSYDDICMLHASIWLVAEARPVMRRHHSGSARVATISHTAVIAPDAALTEGREHTEDTEDKVEPKQRRLEVREQGIFSPDILVDFSTDGIRNEQSVQSLTFQNEQSVHISFCARLWLGFCLSTIGSLITYLYLQAQRGQEVAPEESLPPRPGTISASVQILCITSLSISYGAMISSMTIFVLPKEAEHFFPNNLPSALAFWNFWVLWACWVDRLLDRYQPLGSRICVEKIFSASQGFLTSGIVLELIWIVFKAEHHIVKEFMDLLDGLRVSILPRAGSCLSGQNQAPYGAQAAYGLLDVIRTSWQQR